MKTLIASALFVCFAVGPLCAATVSAAAPPSAVPRPPSALPTPSPERELRRAERAANAEMELNVSASPTPRRKIMASAGSSSPKALIVYSNAPDVKAHEETIEDMHIMARILEKVVHESGNEANRHAMGIPLLSLSAGKAPRHTRLQGYGALFTFNVDYPLRAGEEKPAVTGQPPAPRTDWERTRRELYGREEGFNPYHLKMAETTQPYDAELVKRLQESVLQGLKNATHLRHFSPQEVVTVVVTSPGSRRDLFLYQVEEFSGPEGIPFGFSAKDKREKIETGKGSDSVLTISARKEDIDQFAEEKITLEDFRKRAVPLIY